ncbi:FHA domain-containing protein [Xenophilus aerolatus]|jgi:pSer/pThr/pTyr-binding forkhead associated (FHA) protein|nr:FHA domain-containing protein [Xenophilus aerolatus]
MARLIIVDARRAVRQINLDMPLLTIGREAGNVVMLASERVSRRHAVIERVDDGHILTDLDSLNGTFVNGAPLRIRSHRLRHGDSVTLGRCQLRFLQKAGTSLAADALRLLTLPAELPRRGWGSMQPAFA